MPPPVVKHPPCCLIAILCLPLLASIARADNGSPERIDRHALVTRHNITWNDVAGQIPVGNGEFCFNADATGLETFGGLTMAHWAWHSFPLPPGWTMDMVPATGTFQKGRNTPASGDHRCLAHAGSLVRRANLHL